jgi:hypothetical protein
MAANKKISELVALLGADASDTCYFEIVDPTEVDPVNQNKKMTLMELRIATGIYDILEITGITTEAQDNALIGKTFADIKQVNINGADQLTGNIVTGLDDITGTIQFQADVDFGGVTGYVTVKA